MKKTLLLLCALMVSIGISWGQTNLALNKTSKATSGSAANAVDGNIGTRWESVAQDANTWQVDLGADDTEFNAISIVWETAYAKAFTIETGNTVDSDGYLTGGTVVHSETNYTGGGNLVSQIINLASTAKGRYVKFTSSARATDWGVSFYEFGVYNESSALTAKTTTVTISTPSTTIAKDNTATFTLTAKDQFGGNITPSSVTWKSSDTGVATIADGKLTGVSAGTTTVTAEADGVTSNAVEMTVIAASKISIATDAVFPIGIALADGKANAFDDNDGSLWSFLSGNTGDSEEARTYNVGFIADLKGTYDLSQVNIHFEGACSKNFTIYVAGEDGNFSEAATGGTNVDGTNNHTEVIALSSNAVRYIKFLSTKAASGYGVKIYEFVLYGTEKSTVSNSTAPTNPTYSVTEQAETSFKVSLTSTATNGKFVNYNISYKTGEDAATSLQLSGESGVALEKTFSDLAAATTYNFTVTAVDAFGLSSSSEVEFTASTTGADTTAPVLNSATLKSVGATNATLTLKATDEASATVTFTIVDETNGVNVESTAINSGEEGDYTVTGLNPGTSYNFTVKAKDATGNVSENSLTVSATTTAIPASSTPDKLAVNVKSLFSDAYTSIVGVDWQATWEGGSTIDDVELSDNAAKKISAFKGFGITMPKTTITDLVGSATAGYLHFDIYPTAVAKIQLELTHNDGYIHYDAKEDVSITSGDLGNWKGYDIPLTTFTTSDEENINAILFNSGDGSAAFYIDNVYFYKVVADATIVYGDTDENGVSAVTGTLTSAKLTDFNAKLTGGAYDLTGMNLAEAVTITPANVNAVLIVTAAQKSALAGTKNMIVPNAAGTAYTADEINYVDTDGSYPATGLSITAATVTYERTLSANACVTMSLPFTPDAIPAEVEAYTMSKYNEGNVTFSKVDAIEKGKPYLVINNSADKATLSTTSATLDFTEGETTADGATFHANLKAMIETSESDATPVYMLQGATKDNLTIKKGTGAKLGVFRGYFKGVEASGSASQLTVLFEDENGDDNTTKIGVIDASGNITVGEAYNLNGQRVARPTKGLYIVNGKKVVIK